MPKSKQTKKAAAKTRDTPAKAKAKAAPTRHGRKYAITVMSLDRVGIVSNVTGSILELGGNIDKLSQTVMDAYFTILITAVFPERLDAAAIRDALKQRGAHLDLDVMVESYQASPTPRTPRTERKNVYVLTVTGGDRPGIIHEIAGRLAAYGVNIIDLFCFLREPENFVMVSEIDVPPDSDLPQIQIDLEEVAQNGTLTVRIQHENLFLATNALYLSRPELPAP